MDGNSCVLRICSPRLGSLGWEELQIFFVSAPGSTACHHGCPKGNPSCSENPEMQPKHGLLSLAQKLV